jgi:hypothetical protein
MKFLARSMFLMVLVSTNVTWAQKESDIPIVELSKAHAPVRITGQITTKDQPSDVIRYSIAGDIDLKNVSTQPIILMVARIDVISGLPVDLNYSENEDYFFESKILQPGSAAKLRQVLSKFGEPQGSRNPLVVTKPSARARTIFVQFLDGSTWGETAAAKQPLWDRRESLRRLEILEENYRTQGEEGFLKSLLQPTLLQPVMALQDIYHEKRDLSLVLARLNEMRENARERSLVIDLPISDSH